MSTSELIRDLPHTIQESSAAGAAAARREEFKLGYLPALDGLRGVSILMVMGFHGNLPFAAGGHIGVDLFFVVSGFLITSLLVQEWQRTGAISFKKFYV